MFDLTGKIALVTGSSRGIGRGIALAFARQGADVVINCAGNVAAAEKTAEDARALGVRALVYKADVSEEDQVAAMFDKIMAEFGRLDILVNCAGTSQDKNIFEMDKADWDRIIKTNLTSGMLCSKRAMEIMRGQKSGRIIFISSVVAERGALFGHVHYAATKAGQIGIVKSMARTAAPLGITVNAIAPGLIATELLVQTHGEEGVKELGANIPLGLGEPADVGAAAVYLA
ncbi:MAG: 3-oxoacyl-ACP reductase FabG, partial [Clostridia bacterium]|nr:3-oxoacyl-ACP reductase FabG [Clostridia bacterium]